MDIDMIDRKILYELDKDSRQSDSMIAKKLTIGRNVVNYRINKMIKKGIIVNFVTLINPASFGKTIYKMYIKLQDVSENVQTNIIDNLLNNKKTFWITRCDGIWDLVIAVSVKDPIEFYKFYIDFSTRFNKYIQEKMLTNQVEVPFFNRSYLIDGYGSLKCIWGGELRKILLDEEDMKILKILPKNARTPSTELAEKIGSTARIVSYRIRQLLEKEVILAFSVQLDINKIGFDYYKSIIYLKDLTEKKEKEFIEYCKSIGCVLYYIKTLGPWELELEFELPGYKAYNEVMKSIRQRFGNIIRNYETLLITEEYKGEYNTLQ